LGSFNKTSAQVVGVSLLPIGSPTLHNYPAAWSSGSGFGRPLLNSVIVTSCQIALNMFAACLAGFGFAKYKFRGREALFLGIIALTLLPIQMIIIPLFLVIKHLGWQDSYQGLIIPTAVTALGVLIMRQFIAGLPDELIDAARVDGAHDFRIWYRLIVPLSAPALVTVGVLTGLASWDSLIWPLILISSTPMQTMSLAIAALNSVYQAPLTWLMAMATVMVLPPLLAFIASQGRLVQSVAIGSSFR
jgi:multiple sugar transport system permease protein